MGKFRVTLARDSFVWNGKAVLIGASTGGVEALEALLAGFPKNCPPTLVCQHMPAKYLGQFAARLNKQILAEVLLAQAGIKLQQGCVYIAPGGAMHLELQNGRCHLRETEKVNGHRPSVDVMFQSAVTAKCDIVAVLLTGMGDDGAKGLLALRKSGAVTIGQDAETCVVYGMPRVADEIGAVMHQVALPEIAGLVLKSCRSGYDRQTQMCRGD